jgi:hypothetical protein
MMQRTSKASRSARLLTTLALAAGLGAASAGAARAESGLAGTWTVQVTLRDCATQAPVGSFSSLVTFHRGGTISETAGSRSFAAGQRSPAQGTWVRKGDKFRQRMIALVVFDTAANLPGTPTFDPTQPVSPGFRAGWQTVHHTLDLVDDDHLTSAGSNDFYDAAGAIYRTGCSTATGQRFK